MTASTLTGDDIVNRRGQTLGKVSEIMIDVPRGRIAYVVMSTGGFLGLGDKLFALPWAALSIDPEHHRFVIDADTARFDDAPGFNKNHWPDSADFELLGEIDQYWGYRPYWE